MQIPPLKITRALMTIGFWHGPWVRKIFSAVKLELCALF